VADGVGWSKKIRLMIQAQPEAGRVGVSQADRTGVSEVENGGESWVRVLPPPMDVSGIEYSDPSSPRASASNAVGVRQATGVRGDPCK